MSPALKMFNIVKNTSNPIYNVYLEKTNTIFITDNISRFYHEKIRWISVGHETWACVSTMPRKKLIKFLKSIKTGQIEIFNNLGTFISTTITAFKRLISGVVNPHTYPLVLDILALLTSFNTYGSWTPVVLLSNLVRFWSIYVRGQLIFGESETFVLAAVYPLLPPVMADYLKKISLFTSKRVVDAPNVFLDLISYVSGFLLECLEKIPCVPDSLKTLLSRFFHMGARRNILSNLHSTYIAWKNNRRILIEEPFRVDVKDTYEKVSNDELLKEFMKTNIHATNIYKDFIRLYKSVINYENCSRPEPACLILDGPPGTQKSIFVTQLLQYLGESSYIHATKSIDDGKDFYDTYNNETIFVMDDVGQQSTSQWRSLINMVSVVKMPLDCASADLKDTKFFNSEMILLTTNNFKNLTGLTKSDCIASIEALHRRGHVIDFSQVTNRNGNLIGILQYSRFDIDTKKWVHTFVDNKPFTPAVDVSNKAKSLAWLVDITRRLRAHYNKVKSSCDMTETLRSSVDHILENDYHYDNNDNYVDVDDQITITSSPVSQTQPSLLRSVSTNQAQTSSAQTQSNNSSNNTSHLNQSVLTSEFNFFDMSSAFVVHYCHHLLREYISSISTSIFDLLEVSSFEIKKFIPLSALVVSSVLLYKIFRSFFLNTDNEDNNNLDDFESYTKYQVVQKWKTAMKARNVTKQLIKTAQGITVQECQSGVPTNVTALRQRMGIAEFPYMLEGSSGYFYCQALVSGHYLIMVGHTVEDPNVAKVLNFYTTPESMLHDSPLLNNIPYKVVYNNIKTDICVLELPINSIAPFKSCEKFLKETSKPGVYKPYFVNCFGELDIGSSINTPSETQMYKTYNRTHFLVGGNYFEYDVSAGGLCGSLIVDGTAGIIGMHVAGDNGTTGNAVIFGEEDRRNILNILQKDKNLIKDEGPFKDVGDLTKHKPKLEFSGAEYPSEVSMHVPSKTSLVPSPLHNYTPPTKQPANLSAYGPKTVVRMADKSYKPIPFISEEVIDFAGKCIDMFLCDYEELTEEEIVSGNEYISGINKDSVNGYGYDKDKYTYIDFQNKCFKPEFKKQFEDLENRIIEGKVNVEDVLYYETLKNELRADSKVNKPRSFRVCPLALCLLTKKYVGNLFKHVVKNKWFNQIMIGANPYADWDRLYEELTLNAALYFDGDLGNYDGGQAAQMQDKVHEKVKNRYKGKNPQVLEFVLENVVRAFVLTLNNIRVGTHSIPSGSWITALFNSFNNRGYTACVYYINSLLQNKKPTVSEYLTIKDFVCGDDKLCSVPRSLQDRVNAITMREFFEDIGMTFTNGDKTPIVEKGRPLDTLTFLKRSFLYHKQLNKIVGPLSTETLSNSIQWVDSKKDANIVMKGKLEAYQREMYLHEELYKNDIDNLENHCNNNNINFTRLPLEYLKNLFTYDLDEAFYLYKRDFDKNYN